MKNMKHTGLDDEADINRNSNGHNNFMGVEVSDELMEFMNLFCCIINDKNGDKNGDRMLDIRPQSPAKGKCQSA